MIHPIAIWVWAFSLSILQSHSTTISIFTILIICFFTVRTERIQTEENSTNPIRIALAFSAFAAVVRLIFGVIIGVPQSGSILLTLPRLPLPDWLAGITIGGAVSLERLQLVGVEILKFTSVLLIFAFATYVTSVNQLMRIFMRRFRTLGTAMVISISIIPQLVGAVRRIKVAQRMRGINQTSLRNWRYIAAPVIEESLERAIDLAANLESKGFGYHKKPTTYSAMNIGFSEKTILLSALFLFLISFSDLTQINILAIALLITVLSIVQIHSSNFAFQKKLTTKNQLARSR